MRPSALLLLALCCLSSSSVLGFATHTAWLTAFQLDYFRKSLTSLYNEPALKIPEAKRTPAALEKIVDKYWPDRVNQLWAGLIKKYPDSIRAQLVAGKQSLLADGNWMPVPATASGRAQDMMEPYVDKARFEKAFALVKEGGEHVQKSEYAEGVQKFHEALKLDPYEAQALGMLGWIFMTQQQKTTDVADAIFFLRQSLHVAPDGHGHRFNLARLLQETGEVDAAHEQFTRLLSSMGPSNPKYKDVEKRLKECDATLDAMKDEI